MDYVKARQNLRETSKKIFGVLSLASAILFGIGLNRTYSAYLNLTKDQALKAQLVKKQVKVAITNQGELIILDKETGEYSIYSDSIGNSIFELYATRIYSQYKSK